MPLRRRSLPASLLALAWLSLGSAAYAQTPPSARLTAVQRDVEVVTAEPHPGRPGETLERGTRVQTGPESSAEVTLADGTRLLLGERSTLVMFTSLAPPMPGQPPSTTTTLPRGLLRVVPPAEGASAQPFPIATGALTAFFRRATATLQVDGSTRLTRVSVYQGRVRVRSGTRELTVTSGNGYRGEVNGPPLPPRPLPAPPAWLAPPPSMLVSYGEPMDVSGTYGLRGAPPPAQWRVVMARDEGFTSLLSSQRVAGSVTRFTARALEPGTYWVRVSALDLDRFEGAPGPAARVVIAAPRILSGEEGRRASVELPQGFHCGLDGAPLATSNVPLELSPGRDHVLRCATRPDGADAREMRIPATQCGPLHREVRVEPQNLPLRGGLGVLVVRLSDARRVPVSWANFQVTTSAGVSLGDLREDEQRGTYHGILRWDPGTREATVRFVLNGSETFEEVLR